MACTDDTEMPTLLHYKTLRRRTLSDREWELLQAWIQMQLLVPADAPLLSKGLEGLR